MSGTKTAYIPVAKFIEYIRKLNPQGGTVTEFIYGLAEGPIRMRFLWSAVRKTWFFAYDYEHMGSVYEAIIDLKEMWPFIKKEPEFLRMSAVMTHTFRTLGFDNKQVAFIPAITGWQMEIYRRDFYDRSERFSFDNC